MPVFSARAKTVTYSLKELEFLEHALESIEDIALNEDSISCDLARSIIMDANAIRDSLKLKIRISRHDKFVPKLNES